MWNEQLAARACNYTSGVLSIVDDDGYPMSVRCTAYADAACQVFTFPSPPALAADWRGKACLLFHEFNEQLEGLKQMVILGELVSEDGLLTLQVSKFVTANGRSNTDQMPHASSPFHMLQFFFLGRRNARTFLARRGKPWPPIPYDVIERLLAEEA
ncbi:MAG TPA: hypothetical protein VKV40_24020 [Ktedonobacteraceae bacterium]|nr:hypothetical protein [Ktedonobacteraceae bacterium]